MRLRRSAARWMGKIRGPKVSSSEVRLHAGWNGDRRWPGGIKAAPSEADRFLVWPRRGPGRPDLKLRAGDDTGVSTIGFSGCGTDVSLAPLWSQYSSRSCVCFPSVANALDCTTAPS